MNFDTALVLRPLPTELSFSNLVEVNVSSGYKKLTFTLLLCMYMPDETSEF